MNKNYKINELLGAKLFKKCVFKVEHIKFKIIDKFFPNSELNYEKYLKKSLNKELNKEISIEKKNLIIRNYQKKILISRKEFNNKKNRNYHIKMDNPNDFIEYLKKNRKIHINGLIKNGIVYLGLIPLFIIQNPIFTIAGYVFLSYNTISTLINFQCVNLQNYNLKRFEDSKEKLMKMRKRKQEKDLEKYGKISKVISSSLNNSTDIPSVEEIVSNITTKEQLIELKKMLISYGMKENKGTEEKKNNGFQKNKKRR